jgi:lactaldehyde dehydrogenase/glycolaldehyde dehydrogenase
MNASDGTPVGDDLQSLTSRFWMKLNSAIVSSVTLRTKSRATHPAGSRQRMYAWIWNGSPGDAVSMPRSIAGAEEHVCRRRAGENLASVAGSPIGDVEFVLIQRPGNGPAAKIVEIGGVGVPDYENFIGGKFVPSSGRERVENRNPANGKLICTVPDSTAADVEKAVGAADTAQKDWARRPAIERAKALRAIAARIRENAEQLSRIITEEQGKVLDLARVEVAFTADYLDYMAEWARRIEGEILESDRPGETIFLFRQPIGVIGGILPWNFPFFLIARKAAPALVTGNTVVIKPSEETPHNAVKFAELLEQTDLPAGVINFVHGRGGTAGKALASSPRVGMISFTGSVETGSAIMSSAAPNITKVNLELGGKAPAIVMADADMDLAVNAVKSSRIINSGQVCNCAERVYVQRRVADEFVEKLAGAMKEARFGDPLGDQAVDYGPLINEAGYQKVDRLVRSAVAAGATVVTGGRRGSGDGGYYYEPTVLSGCRQDMEIIRREVFGPVSPVVTFEDLDEAIEFANDSDYGLTSSIYTRDLDAALRACQEIRFGETYINRENFEAMQGFHAGWRKSGIGGADGKHGLYEYTQTHVVYMQRRV